MRFFVWLLALTVACALPYRTLAASHPASHSVSRTLSCGIQVSSDEVSTYHRLQCITGVAVSVSTRAMRVRPKHGSARSLRLTDETRFETDSGEGALNGLTVADRVCVAYTSGAHALTARVVAFDPSFKPCGPGKHLRPPGGQSGDSVQEQG